LAKYGAMVRQKMAGIKGDAKSQKRGKRRQEEIEPDEIDLL
jgi:hypothetical protein